MTTFQILSFDGGGIRGAYGTTVIESFEEKVSTGLMEGGFESGSLLEIEDLGFNPARLKLVKKLVTSPNGIILVTGPTGSGKTTTLYAILQSINKPGPQW